MIFHLSYIARFFVLFDTHLKGPSSLLMSMPITGIFITSVAILMIVLSRQEDGKQTALLRSRILGRRRRDSQSCRKIQRSVEGSGFAPQGGYLFDRDRRRRRKRGREGV